MLSKNQIKQIQSLQLKKIRDTEKLFIAEGVKSVLEIVETRPTQLKELYATAAFIEKNRSLIKSVSTPVIEINEEELKKISLQSAPNQALAVCHYFPDTMIPPNFESGFYLYLDDVRDPGNLGTIIRLADWFGISTVFCSPGSCDFYNPKVIQSTMGAFLRVNVVFVELKTLINNYSVRAIYGAVLDGKNIYRESLQNGLIIIGNEANGINSENLRYINRPITIPANHNNGTESLNAAMATSIICSEFFRQLRAG